MVRTRFAPSPTGYLHIGGVRTALFNYLYAKKYGGKYVLRIDDTDAQRNMQQALQPILEGFEWLGMTWDEGPGVGGPHGPYFQSQRKERYAEVAEKLRSGGAAYRGVMEKLADNASIYVDDGGAIRLFMGREGKIVLNDLVKGRVEWERRLIKDPVIVRSDGTALYNLATVVDDHDMQITHIFRAEEHLSNTPVQLRIYEALEWEPPQFGHLPFVCAPNSRKKLSKRDMAQFLTPDVVDRLKALGYGEEEINDSLNPATVAYYKAMGFHPMGVCNYLALLGWSLDDKSEFFTGQQLIDAFSVEGIHNAPASFDPKKFLHINGEHLKTLTRDQWLASTANILNRMGIVPNLDTLARVIEACGDRLKTFSDIVGYGIYFFRDPVYDEKTMQKRLADENIRKLLFQFVQGCGTISFVPQTLETKLHEFCDANSVKVGDMVHAIRVAITGQPIGPGVFDCMSILGPTETKRRVSAALQRRI